MACSIQLNTMEFLELSDVISKEGEILDDAQFDSFNESLTELAFTKYGVGDGRTLLFNKKEESIDFGGAKLKTLKAVPKEAYFLLLEEQSEANESIDILSGKGAKDLLGKKETNIFSSKDREPSTTADDPQSPYTKLDSLENKFQYAMQRVQESIQINVDNLTSIGKRAKDEVVQAGVESRIEALTQLRNDIDVHKETNRALAVTSFVKNMVTAMDYIDNKIGNIDYSNVNKVIETADNFSNYLMTFSVVEDLIDVMADANQDNFQKLFSSSELKEIKTKLSAAKGRFDTQSKEILKIKKLAMSHLLNDIKYFPNILTKHKNRLSREYNQLGAPGTKEQFILDKLNGRDKELINQDIIDAVNDLMNNPISDIYASDVTFSAAVNVSSPLIQILNKMLVEVDNKRIEVERNKDLEFNRIFKALQAEKGGTTNINKLYGNIIEKNKDGQYMLKSEYNSDFIKEVRDDIRNVRAEYKESIEKATQKAKNIYQQFGNASLEYNNSKKEISKLIKEKNTKIKAIERANIIYDGKKAVSPTSKWKNNLSLSKAEKDALDFFKSIVDEGHKATYGRNSLRTYSYGAVFYGLPAIHKTAAERVYQGDIKGAVTDRYDYLTKDRSDDIEFTTKNVDLANRQIRSLRVHYRDYNNNFNHSNQSLDLSTIFRLEYKNTNMYDIRKHEESKFNFLLDIAKDKKFYEKEGSRLIKAARNKKLNVTTNTQSNTYKMMTNMLDSRFYDMMNKKNIKIGKADLNKATRFVNSATSFVALSLNIASGTANVVNANAQMFLETFLKGNTFTAANIAKANKIYSQHLAASLQDVVNPVNSSYVNQVTELFNTKGLFNLSESNFLQASLLKKGLDTQSLQVFQDSGEHWIQSVLTMAVLDNIKVMNGEHRFISKTGKVVSSKKQAASLLDMIKEDKATGLVEIDPNVVYTTHSNLTRWNEGGKANIDLLLRKKIDDTIGNYTETQQADVFRHWLGKLGMLYRKYLVPMGQARFRGFEHSGTMKDNLTDEQRTYSYALQEYEEGTYTTLLRYFLTTLKNKKAGLFAGVNWQNLSDYEKHNIKRSVTEIIVTSVILPLSVGLLEAAAKGGDDDDNLKYFLMYQLRRMDTELSAYRYPPEMFKMLKSPIPSARIIETGIDIISSIPSIGETDSKGQNIFLRDLNKLNPARQFTKDYQKVFQYQKSNWGSN